MKTFAQYCKERRESFRAQGFCTNCGKLPPETSKVKCSVCLAASRVSNKKYTSNNPRAKEVRGRWKSNSEARVKHRASRARWRLKLKYKVIISLGGKCECCSDTILEFLQIDHVNKDGKKHRAEIGRSAQMYKDMFKFPNRYQLRVLCANCHFAITNSGHCPHQENKNGFTKIQQDATLTLVAG
jgi:hypothetical protein